MFVRVPAEVGWTAKVRLNDAFGGMVTGPFATQLKVGPLAIAQSIVPVGAVAPFVSLTAPIV